uniref:Tudor domain-containing protein n=1 Tax=Plectus sambesii TaxID=2011161 RepID=A0A914V2U4_9BILA
MDLTFPNLRVLTAGLACAVYNDEHLIWTRSVVKKVSKTETDDDEILEVLSVDYGWLMSVPIVSEPIQFAMLPHNLANFPTQLHRVAVNRSTVSSFERRHRYKKEDEIMRELLPVGTVVMIKGVAPRKKGADLTYSVPVLMKLPQPAQLTAHRDETIWQTVERMYDELECIEKARRAGSQASSEADWSPNGPPDFGRDRLRSSTPDSVLSSPVRQNNQQEKGRHNSPLQQQNNLHQQQDDPYLQHNGPYQLQNVSHQQRNRSPGVPIVRKQAKKQPQELSRVHDRRSGGRARSPSPSPTKRQQP